MTLTWANLLSGLRLAIIPLFVLAVFQGRAMAALTWFVIAGLTDLLDGFVARSYAQQSRLGAYLDPAADKLLLTAAFLVLSWPNADLPQRIPFYVFILVLLRDLFIVIGALIIYLRLRFTGFAPLRLSKWNTAFQIMGAAVVLMAWAMRQAQMAAADFAEVASELMVMMVVGFTVASGLEYIYRFVFRYGDLAAQVAAERQDVPG